jgi:hypothetical protein
MGCVGWCWWWVGGAAGRVRGGGWDYNSNAGLQRRVTCENNTKQPVKVKTYVQGEGRVWHSELKGYAPLAGEFVDLGGNWGG